MTREELAHLVRTDPRYTISALIALYSFQEADEQAIGTTCHQNGKGFSNADSGVLPDIARYYMQRGFLSPRQLDFVRSAIPKYLGQLSGLELTPAKIREPVKAPVNPVNATPQALAEPPKPQRTVKLVNGVLEISFSYDPTVVEQVKGLSGRKWNPASKTWTAPLCDESVACLKEWGFAFDSEIKGSLPTAAASEAKETVTTVTQIPGLKKTLFPYQMEGVNFIQSRKGRTLLADEMGLGKTPQALAWLQLNPQARPAIIVVPASLKLNWEREAKAWMTRPKVQILSGRPAQEYKGDVPLGGEIIIVNYDILPNTVKKEKDPKSGKTKAVEIPGTGWIDLLQKIKPKALIIDEAHAIKNSDALRTKAVLKLAKSVDHMIALSGTPIVNRPSEFFNPISAVAPQMFPSFWKFAHRYCGAHHNGFGWDFNGASNMEELHQRLTSTIMLRRVKKDVLKDLPEKTRSLIPMPLSNEREYRRAELNLIQWLKTEFGNEKAEKAKKAEALTRIEALKQLAVKGKLESAVDWIKDFLESGEKLVVFAVHKNVIDRLMEVFGKMAVKVDGSTPTSVRQQAVDAFQTDDNIRVFVGNIKAAGVGLTLTEASNTCFLELGWSPGDMGQAEDRVHRIGQTADSVTAWYLLAGDTIEEDIATLIDYKRNVLSQALDGKDAEEGSMISELMKKLTKGEK